MGATSDVLEDFELDESGDGVTLWRPRKGGVARGGPEGGPVRPSDAASERPEPGASTSSHEVVTVGCAGQPGEPLQAVPVPRAMRDRCCPVGV